jgi:chorismate-pyruvate lyase
VPSDHVGILLSDKALAIARFINEAMPDLTCSKANPMTNKVLHALNDMWAMGNDKILSVGEINDADVKPEHQSLLGEEKQLTRRLEAHLQDTIEPKVLKSKQRGRLYYRKVALRTKNTQRSAAVAVIRIAMDQFDRDAIEEIIQGERSFGTILSNRNIVYSCSSVNLFQSMPDKSLRQEFELGDEPGYLCGRTNQFKNSEGAVLADVLEILAPWV